MEVLQPLLLAALNGLVIGLTLALVASGLSLIFGVMDIVNFAHGDLYMLGGYLAWLGFVLSGSFAAGLLTAVLGMALLGTLLFSATLTPLLGRHPLHTALATLGLGMIVRESTLMAFGGDAKTVHVPLERSVAVLGLDYPLYRLVVIGVGTALIAGLWVYLQRGRYGLWIRAVAQDREMAGALGVRLPVVYTVVFAVSSAMAALSGALLAPITNVYHSMGLEVILPAFVVVVAGGMGNLKGAVVVSLLLGATESIGSLVVKPTAARTLSFVLLMVLLVARRRRLR
jgi:branched-chain amino acid transport system permease protein